MRYFYVRVSALLICCLLAGCVSAPQSRAVLVSPPNGLATQAGLDRVPFYPQEKYQCGPAALATVLATAGVAVTPADLVDQVYVPGKHGSYQLELVTASRSHGRLATPVSPTMTALLQEIDAGNPVLVMQNLGLSIFPKWHYAVVKGYDLDRGRVLLNSGTREDYALPLRTFEHTWARSDYWGIVVTPPGIVPATTDAGAVFTALNALEKHHAPVADLDRYYQAALRRWPYDVNLNMGYGNRLFARQDLAAAAGVFRRVTGARPDYAPAWNNLAYTLLQQNRADEALEYARTAVALGGAFSEQSLQTYAQIRQVLSARGE